MTHTHQFDETDWPFNEPMDRPSYTSVYIVNDNAPILTIAHDHEGDWQFLCAQADKTEDMALVCLGCLYEKHPEVGELANLEKGWIAWRGSEDDPWQKDLLSDQQDGE